jgi:serine/threonine protein kinase
VVTTASPKQAPLRGGKKGCHPTEDPELLSRDPKKIYQCTRKCGKRYGRKCDWKRNEEEGYPSKSWVCFLCIEQNTERVKPCFRKYHFSQHFRNVHPGLDCADYEEASIVQSDTAFPRKCGFCTHRFVSRQDRIDHIADHFKEGKCMLEWNDDDSSDSDNTDDDDDNNDGRPDSGDFSDSQPRHPGGDDQQRGGSSPSKGSGSGSGAKEKQQHLQGGFYQFQLNNSSCGAEKHIKPSGSNISDNNVDATGTSQGAKFDYTRSSHGESETTERVDSDALARDALSQSLTLFQKSSLDGVTSQLTSDHVRNVIEAIRKTPILRIGAATGRGISDVHTLNALLSILNPTKRQPPLLPPPLPSPGNGIEDLMISKTLATSLVSWLMSERSLMTGLFADQGATMQLRSDQQNENSSMSQATNGMLQVLISSQFHHTTTVLTSKQQYWNGITTLLDKQSFLSVKLLGTGGFSTVDEVVHRETSLRISRKTLKNRHQSALDELKKEVNVLQKLRHPHVIRFLGAYSKGDKMSILLSPVAETTLAVWLDKRSVNKPAGLAHVIMKMLGCLSATVKYLHDQRPVVKHMDIKPQNILVMQGSQEFPHVVLSDFGISSIEDATQDGKYQPRTRQYCAPEVSAGTSRGEAADIFSLGCVFSEMLTVAFSDANPEWLKFRDQFQGRKASYYSRDLHALHDWLTQFVAEASSRTEIDAIKTVKSMLSSTPSKRPNAAKLAMTFMPAPCCLTWPNEQASYPGPLEEIQMVEMLAQEDGVDCHAHLNTVETNVQCLDQSLDALSNVGTSDDRFANAKNWVHECSFEHEACQHAHQQGTTNVLPTRLVDLRPDGIRGTSVRILNSTQLTTSSEPVAYAALSYTWAESDITLSTHDEDMVELPRAMLSQAVNDGIIATERTGYRYLWVDSLCVFQDSAQDKEHECLATADVYRNADLTIVLDQLNNSPESIQAVDDSSSRTCSGTTRNPTMAQDPMKKPSTSSALSTIDFAIPGFAWDTRAWVLQERLLSPRLLHLGPEQMYWECNALKASETFPRGLPPLLWEKVHTKSATSRTTTVTTDVSNLANAGYEDRFSAAANAAFANKQDITRLRSINPTLLSMRDGDGSEASAQATQMDFDLRKPIGIIDDDNVKSKIQDPLANTVDFEPLSVMFGTETALIDENGNWKDVGQAKDMINLDVNVLRDVMKIDGYEDQDDAIGNALV